MWLAKSCHPSKTLRRCARRAKRKWSLPASRRFCSAAHSKSSRWRARRAAIRQKSGSNGADVAGGSPDGRPSDNTLRALPISNKMKELSSISKILVLQRIVLEPDCTYIFLMAAFDYGTVAELFPTRGEVSQAPSRSGRRRRPFPLGYGRFARAAEAIRFAIEELPAELRPSACLEVGDVIFDRDGILRLYESADYPLARRATSALMIHQSPRRYS
jgi:hypothetical protein